MNIKLVKQTFDNNDVSWKTKEMDFCCESMQKNPLIDLENEYDENSGFLEHPNMMLWHSEIIHDWEDEYENDYYYAIKYCPFCGEKIKVVIEEKEDISDVYKYLDDRRLYLSKKRNATDSKKKEAKLSDELKKVDNDINMFYQLCNWVDFEQMLKEVKEEMNNIK